MWLDDNAFRFWHLLEMPALISGIPMKISTVRHATLADSKMETHTAMRVRSSASCDNRIQIVCC